MQYSNEDVNYYRPLELQNIRHTAYTHPTKLLCVDQV